MRRHWVMGALVAGLMVAGCTGQGTQQDDGWSMLLAEDYEGARAHYQSLLDANPNDPYAHLNLGVAYEELGNREMAAKHYEAAITHGHDAKIEEVAADGKAAERNTRVSDVARQNLAGLNG